MAYWIARNNQKVGPYSLDDVHKLMADNKLVATDLAWTDGMANWGPVFDVIPAPQVPEPPPQQQVSPQDLAPTRMLPVMRPPPEFDQKPAPASPQPAAPQPAPVPASAPVTQPAPVQPSPYQPVPPQPAAMQPGSFPGQSQPPGYQPAGQPVEPMRPYSPPAYPSVPAQAVPAQPAPPQAAPAPQSAFAPPPPPPPAQALPYQPYPSAPMPGSPMPAQPMPAQPFGQPANFAPAGSQIPPGMHWALVWVLGAVTFGIFIVVWMFKQANFVKRLDPQNPAVKLFTLSLILVVVYGVLIGIVVVSQSPEMVATAGGIGVLLELVAVACQLVAYFKMRSSLVNYYNTVEPIGLRLSAPMMFFFNLLYFQHHFHRIAKWKQTGVLVPQK